MLKYFRRLRHRLLRSSKFRSYTLYAIGEIALVVIGILIALQINNWNEDRKDRLTERGILLEIQNDLRETLLDLNEDLEEHYLILNSTNLVKKALVNEAPFNDSITEHILNCFRDTRTFYKAGGYEIMLSEGVEIISNDSLRKMITDLYQLGFVRLDRSAEEFENEKVMWPFKQRFFKLSSEIRSFEYKEAFLDTIFVHQPQLLSYEALLLDNAFIMTLQESQLNRRTKIRRCWAVRSDILKVLREIEKALKKRTD